MDYCPSINSDRISDLIDPEPSEPPTWSAARVDASRRNGSKSRGPRTATGKQQSSCNAIKHGLLAKRIAPLEDYRGEHLDYQEHLRGLIDEYQPQTRTEMNFVEMLAGEFIRIGRIGQYREQVMDPAPNPCDCTWLDEDRYTGEVGISERILQHFKDNEPLELSDEEQEWAIQQIAQQVQTKRDDMQSYREYVPASPDDENPWAEDAAAYRTIRAIGATNPKIVRAFLAGQQTAPAPHRAGWLLLFETLEKSWQDAAKRTRELNQQAERACRTAQAKILDRLPTLEQLDAYESRCRRSIDRTIRMLLEFQDRRERSFSGSFEENTESNP